MIGTVLDNTYRITGVLGEGGMGVVYKARDIMLEIDVAVKMMDSYHARDPEFIKMFKREAQALAALQNQNIVNVKALKQTEMGFCIVMEYVDGKTLADVIKQKQPIEFQRILRIFGQLLSAFDHAHRAGIVHRDIKPGNIMLSSDDGVKVTDFGLAKRTVSSAETVTYGKRMGTIPYMSPEQAKGLGDLDARSDIYSIGMTLYECLTGILPFSDGQTEYDVIQQKIEGKIPPPDKLNPAIGREMVKVVMKSIEKAPGDRYQSASEMWAAMEKLKPAAGVVKNDGRRRSPVKNAILYGASAAAIAAVLFLVYMTVISPPAPAGAVLSVTSDPPGSSVTINGKPAGTTPINGLEHKAEDIALRLELRGYEPRDSNMSLKAGQRYDISIPLVKNPVPNATLNLSSKSSGSLEKMRGDVGSLVVQAIPAGSIWVDGTLKSSNGGQPTTLTLTAGPHSVAFGSPGCGEKKEQVDIQKGKSAALTWYFEAQANIQSLDEADEPLFGTIMVDGVNTGIFTPKSGYALSCGSHKISVTKFGYTTIDGPQTVAVQPSKERKTFELVFHLKSGQKN